MQDKYFKMLDKLTEEKIDITKLYNLSCCPFATDELNWALMEYTYECWLYADTDLDLAKLTTVVADNWQEIQNEEIQMDEIITICLS